MAQMPHMPLTGKAVALVAGVLDHRDGAPRERLKELGEVAGKTIKAGETAELVVTQAFVSAALAEIAAEALETTVEEVLCAVLDAGNYQPKVDG